MATPSSPTSPSTSQGVTFCSLFWVEGAVTTGLAGMGEGGASMPPEMDDDWAGVGVDGAIFADEVSPGVLGRDELGVGTREGVVDLESAGLRGLCNGSRGAAKAEKRPESQRSSSREPDELTSVWTDPP